MISSPSPRSVALVMLFALATACAFGQQASAVEVFAQTGHAYGIDATAFSPDAKHAVTLSIDTMKLWEVDTGRLIRTFVSRKVLSAIFLPDGKKVLAGSPDGNLAIVDLATGNIQQELTGHTERITSLSISADGTLAVSGSVDKTMKLWDLTNGKELRSFIGHREIIESVSISPNGKQAVSASYDSLILWDVSSGKAIRTIVSLKSDHTTSVAFTPDGKYAVSGSREGNLRLLDLSSGKERLSYSGHSGEYPEITSIAISKNGKYLLSGSGDKTARLWDLKSGKEVKVFTGHTGWIKAVAFSADSKKALIGSEDGTAKIWEIPAGKEIIALSGHSASAWSVSFTPDGKRAISGSSDGIPRLWDLATGRMIRSFPKTGDISIMHTVAISPDGLSALSANKNSLRIWDLDATGGSRSFTGSIGNLYSASFSPDGKCILTGDDDGKLILWEIASGQAVRSFSSPKDSILTDIFSLSISPDGKKALSGSWDTISLWDIDTGSKLWWKSLDNGMGTSVAFSPNGKLALSSYQNGARLWDVASGDDLLTLKGSPGAFITSVSFFQDGRRALTSSGEGTISIWDLSNGAKLQSFTINTGFLKTAALSPDEKRIIVVDRDSGMLVLDLESGWEIARMIGFSDGEWLAMTPDCYFAASPNGANKINVVQGWDVYSIDNLFETYCRPDIIRDRLKGKQEALVFAPSLKDIKSPPKLSLLVKLKDGSFNSPELVPSSEVLIVERQATVRVVAVDTGGGIRDLRLFNNGKIVGEGERGLAVLASGQTFERSFIVPLVPGVNQLRAVAFAQDMTESNPFLASIVFAEATREKTDLYILTVGIDQYRNSSYNLEFSADDARSFARALERRAKLLFGTIRTIELIDDKATRASLFAAFEDLKTRVKPSDVFVFFYAGHGVALDIRNPDGQVVSEFMYVLRDVTQMSDPVRCATDGISGTEMRSLLREVKANKQVIFVDACNSGTFINQFTSRGAAEENALAKLSRATGSVVFASTTKEQAALEFQELQHGVFTYVVLEALGSVVPPDGSKPSIGALSGGQYTIAGIKAYVDDKIPEYTLRYKGSEQYPTTFMWGQDFPLGTGER